MFVLRGVYWENICRWPVLRSLLSERPCPHQIYKHTVVTRGAEVPDSLGQRGGTEWPVRGLGNVSKVTDFAPWIMCVAVMDRDGGRVRIRLMGEERLRYTEGSLCATVKRKADCGEKLLVPCFVPVLVRRHENIRVLFLGQFTLIEPRHHSEQCFLRACHCPATVTSLRGSFAQ